MGFILSDLITSLERIADHCSNIGVCVHPGQERILYDTHSHLESFYRENEPDQIPALSEEITKDNRLEELS